MHIITTCGTADSNYLGMFCLNGAPVKAYDVFEVNNDLSNPVVIHRTDYFNLNNQPVALMPGDILVAGMCQNDIDSEITCVTENESLYILRFNVSDGEYHLYDFNGNDVTGDFTPTQCPGAEERYDIANAGPFCDDGNQLNRYDVVDLTTQLPIGSYFTDMLGTIVVPTGSLVPGSCSDYVAVNAGGLDVVADLTVTGSAFGNYIPQQIKSLSIITNSSPVSIYINGNMITLESNSTYTWATSQGYIDTNTFEFINDGDSLQLTWLS